MNKLLRCTGRLTGTLLFFCTALPPLLLAHEGHGQPGTVGHDLQHQLWTFAALVVLSAIVLALKRRKQ